MGEMKFEGSIGKPCRGFAMVDSLERKIRYGVFYLRALILCRLCT